MSLSGNITDVFFLKKDLPILCKNYLLNDPIELTVDRRAHQIKVPQFCIHRLKTLLYACV